MLLFCPGSISFMGNFCSTNVESWETFLFLECLSHSIKVQVCLTRKETVWKPLGQMEKMRPRIIVMLDWVSKEMIQTAPFSHYTSTNICEEWIRASNPEKCTADIASNSGYPRFKGPVIYIPNNACLLPPSGLSHTPDELYA